MQDVSPTPLRIVRKPELRTTTGLSNSTTVNRIAAGLMTPPVSLGPRSVGWPLHEVHAIVAARVAGKSDGDIRALVSSLVAARSNFS